MELDEALVDRMCIVTRESGSPEELIRFVAAPDGTVVADLKRESGGTIGTAGSPTLVRSLIEFGLLDELTLMISPVVAGGGRARLFPDGSATRNFELVEAQPTSSGTVIATYRPVR